MEDYCTAGQTTDDNIMKRMRSTCWIIKATDTPPENVIVIDFRRQACVSDRVWILSSFTYIACLFLDYFFQVYYSETVVHCLRHHSNFDSINNAIVTCSSCLWCLMWYAFLYTPDFNIIYGFDIAGNKYSYVNDVCVIYWFIFLCF
jgi:hypothetical protein